MGAIKVDCFVPFCPVMLPRVRSLDKDGKLRCKGPSKISVPFEMSGILIQARRSCQLG